MTEPKQAEERKKERRIGKKWQQHLREIFQN